jgi:hypothetical protein
MTESEDQYCKKTADNTPVSGNRHYLRAPKTRYQSNGWEFFTVDSVGPTHCGRLVVRGRLAGQWAAPREARSDCGSRKRRQVLQNRRPLIRQRGRLANTTDRWRAVEFR